MPNENTGGAGLRAPANRRGPVTRFPEKHRIPFSLCLPAGLHVTLQRTADRLRIKRGDVICELLVQYADGLKISSRR